MRKHRIFCEQSLSDKHSAVISSASLLNQLRHVFRLEIGEQIILFDNSGFDYTSEISRYEKDGVTITIVGKEKNNVSLNKEIYLFASIIKKDNFEWIVEKATEMGVSHIIPILSARSEKKNLNMERLRKIIIESSEQSGRGTIPTIVDILNLKDALLKYASVGTIVWHPEAPKFVSQDLQGKNGLFIGPDGGWSEEELQMFADYSIQVRSLGSQILRSETAVIATLSTLVF